MKNVYTKSDNMLDLIDGLFDSSIDCGDGVESYPTTQEIRDKNYFKLYTKIIGDGYKICTAPV